MIMLTKIKVTIKLNYTGTTNTDNVKIKHQLKSMLIKISAKTRNYGTYVLVLISKVQQLTDSQIYTIQQTPDCILHNTL